MTWFRDWLRAAGIYAAVALTGGVLGGHGDNLGERTARADSRETEQVLVAEEACNRFFLRDGVAHYYAEHAFSGRKAASLARISVLAHLRDVDDEPPGYAYRVVHDGISVRDGFAAIGCGTSTEGLRFDSVTFVVPRNYQLELDKDLPW